MIVPETKKASPENPVLVEEGFSEEAFTFLNNACSSHLSSPIH